MKARIHKLLRGSEKYTKTDMVYFARSNFWMVIGRVISIGSGIFLTISFANLLSPTEFGTYKYILATAGALAAFSLTGLNTAIARAVALGNRHIVQKVFREGVRWSIPASIIALALSLYYFFRGNVVLGAGCLIIAIVSPLLNNLGISKALFQGTGDFRTGTLYGIPRTIVPIILLIATLLVTKNMIVIVAVYFFSNLVAAWIMYRASLKKLDVQDNPGGATETIRYGKHMSVLGFFMQVSSQADQLLLWHLAGPTHLAMYALALAPVRELRNFGENFFPIIFPKFATRSIETLRTSIPLRIKQMLIVSCALGIVYIIFAPLLFTTLFPKYLPAIFASQILAAALIFQPKGIIETLLTAHARTRTRYTVVISTEIARIILLIALIPPFGIMGAVAASVTADAVSALILWIAYRNL